MQSSMETWKEEVQQLREALAAKEEQLSRAVKRRQMRTVAHVEVLTQLNTAQAALKESDLRCASLEETLHNQQQEIEERHKRELKEQEEGLKQKLLGAEEEFERKLEDDKQRFNKEKETLKQKLLLQETKFQKLLEEEKHNYNGRIVEQEGSLKQQLLAKDEAYKTKLNEVCQRWEKTAEKWVQMREELEQKVQQSQQLRQEEDDKTKEELQRLSEAILQLQLQVSKKKKKKGFWRSICKRMKFWK